MVIDGVDHPDLLTGREPDLGGVDLPEVLEISRSKRLLKLFLLGGWSATKWFRLKAWWMVEIAGGETPDRSKLGSDPASAPAGMILPHPTDLHFEVGVDVKRRVEGSAGLVLESFQTFCEVATPVLVVGLPRDPVPTADFGNGRASAFGLLQHFKSQLSHAHHPQGHRFLLSIGLREGLGLSLAVSGIYPERQVCLRNVVRHVSSTICQP
jgi:hypothetical protein